jgi:predicted ArsR family transcriptional regulator
MQATRSRILTILKEQEQATVDELSEELGLTAVTVRHHLDILRGEGLVAPPSVRRRRAPGRPQYVYTLTERASRFFPKRYNELAKYLMDELKTRVSETEVEEMMRQISQRIAAQADLPEGDFETRLNAVVEFLNGLGYLTRVEQENASYILHVANCPYERVSHQHDEVCIIDETLLTLLLDQTPERIAWAAHEDHQCAYRIHPPSA